MKNRILVALIATGIALSGVIVAAPAAATQPDFICEPYDSGKIDTVGDPATVEVTAPAGKLISGYCVKAGTVKVFVPVTPPAKVVIVDHPTKDSVSHYSLVYVDEPAADPIRVNVNLTYIMDCAPDPAATWRVRNPHSAAVETSWRNAANTLTGTHTATPGDSFFEVPNGTGTIILSWGGGDTGIIAGSVTKAEGTTVNPADPKCTGPQPETKVEYGNWVTGQYDCDDTTVTETRTVTTTTYALVDNKWVGTPVVTEESRVRDLTAEEIDALFCPGPQPDDKVTFSEWADGKYDCGDTTVEQTRTKTTTTFVLDGETWVEGESVVEQETQTRDLTDAEIAALDCDVTPPPADRLATTGAVNPVSLGLGALVLGLLGAASLLVQRLRKA